MPAQSVLQPEGNKKCWRQKPRQPNQLCRELMRCGRIGLEGKEHRGKFLPARHFFPEYVRSTSTTHQICRVAAMTKGEAAHFIPQSHECAAVPPVFHPPKEHSSRSIFRFSLVPWEQRRSRRGLWLWRQQHLSNKRGVGVGREFGRFCAKGEPISVMPMLCAQTIYNHHNRVRNVFAQIWFIGLVLSRLLTSMAANATEYSMFVCFAVRDVSDACGYYEMEQKGYLMGKLFWWRASSEKHFSTNDELLEGKG